MVRDMKAPNGRKALKEAIRRAGSGAALGRLFGVTRQAVDQAVKRGFAPREWCEKIEREYGISRRDLRPDIWEWACDTIEPRAARTAANPSRR